MTNINFSNIIVIDNDIYSIIFKRNCEFIDDSLVAYITDNIPIGFRLTKHTNVNGITYYSIVEKIPELEIID